MFIRLAIDDVNVQLAPILKANAELWLGGSKAKFRSSAWRLASSTNAPQEKTIGQFLALYPAHILKDSRNLNSPILSRSAFSSLLYTAVFQPPRPRWRAALPFSVIS
jgi:hypothetical protein